MLWDDQNDMYPMVNNNINIEKNNVQKKNVQKWWMTIDLENCKIMPWMNWCKEILDKENAKNLSSSSIVVLNNNQQLWDIPMDEWKIDIIFEIQNTGSEDIILWDANWSCFCTQWYITNEDGSDKSVEFNTIWAKYPTDINRVIKAWEKQIVTAVYDPEAHGPNAVWPTSRGLTIKTNSIKTPNIKLNFFGTVVKTRSK